MFLLTMLITASQADSNWQTDWETGLLDTGSKPAPTRFSRTPPAMCSTQALHNGIQLPEQTELYIVRNPVEAWGTPEMIEAVITASEEMAWLMPHADPLLVGDISRKHGGYLPPHRSHRSGLDADIGIFTVGARMPASAGFPDITPATIDYEANWMFWSSLLETGLVERILLDQTLIDAMREWTIKEGVLSETEANRTFPKRNTPRLWTMNGVFQHVPGHRDHIHLRVLCGEALVN
jgi:murein endopeptidase